MAGGTVDETEALQRFHAARAEFQAYMVVKKELEWRARHVLPTGDAFRRAVEQLVWNSGVSHFQSCADDCAERFGATCPGGEFPGFESFMDVFYGDSGNVSTRASEWSKEFGLRWSPSRRTRQGFRTKPKPRPTLLDRSLLEDAGLRGLAFMTAVRALPGFNQTWDKKMVHSGVALVVEDGDLLAKEMRFRRNLAKATRVLEDAPLNAQDVYDIALALRRVLPSEGATNVILRFVAKCPGAG